MVRGHFIIYSDQKIALELNLNTGELSLPSVIVDKSINHAIKKALSIEVVDFKTLKEDKDSLFMLIGDWEGKLKPNSPLKRIIWLNIKDALDKIEESHKSILTFFRENYREVILNDKTVGIASIDECNKYNLATRRVEAFILNEDKQLMLKKEKNDKLSSLFAYPMLCESGEEAIYRLLSEEFGTLTEIKKYKQFKDKLNSVVIFTGSFDQSLTFFSESIKKAIFRPLNILKESITLPNPHEEILSEGLKNVLKAYFSQEQGLNA